MNDVRVENHLKNIGLGWILRRYVMLFVDSDKFAEKWSEKLRITSKKKRRKRRRCRRLIVNTKKLKDWKQSITPTTKFPAVDSTWKEKINKETHKEFYDSFEIDDDFLPIAGKEFSSDGEDWWHDD